MSSQPESNSALPDQTPAEGGTGGVPLSGSSPAGQDGALTVSQLAAIEAWREEVRAAGERYRSAQARRYSLKALFFLLTLACLASAALGFLLQFAAHALSQLHGARRTLDSIEAEAVQILRQPRMSSRAVPEETGVRVYADRP
jgi:hypothetical protein